MICDEFLDAEQVLYEEAAEKRGARDPSATFHVAMSRALAAAERFVLSPQTVVTVADLAGSYKDQAFVESLFLPAPVTWVEWQGETQGNAFGGRKHGFLFISDEKVKAGIVVYYTNIGEVAGERRILTVIGNFDFERGVMLNLAPITDASGERAAELDQIRWRIRSGELDVKALGTFAGAALALINTPRVSERVPSDLAKLNKARAKKGRPQLLSWSEVRLRPGVLPHGVGRGIEQHGGKAFHFVRAFFRLRLGRWEVVRPHSRGNPELGVRRHRYVVHQPGEAGGGWKGGALPGPVPLDPGGGEGA